VTDQSWVRESSNVMRTIRVSQGLFVLRYVTSKAGLNAPLLEVSAAASSGVELIFPHGGAGARLATPGDAMVVRAARDSLISIAVTPSHRHGSCDAELVLERVSTTLSNEVAVVAPTVQEPRRPAAVEDIRILAHVARRGDIIVPAGQWICGPDLPMAIEGLEIRWPSRPAGVEIIAKASHLRGGAGMIERGADGFLGTRGKASPLTSLVLSLQGPGSDDLTLRCDALFLGLPVMTVSGRSCVLRGTSGTEPLVGLRLSVASAEERAARKAVDLIRDQAADAPAAPLAPAPARQGKPGKVRVFRSSKVRPSAAYSFAK
jgi:hypothetical protein